MVQLISLYENKLFFEDLGIGRIAAFLKERGIQVKVQYLKCGEPVSEPVWNEIIVEKYVGFSVYDNNIDFADDLTRKIKMQNSSRVCLKLEDGIIICN
jgi:hypothetical protein